MFREDDPTDQLSPFVASKITLIERHADAYLETLAAPESGSEQDNLDQLDRRVERVLAEYDPPSTRRAGDSLVFARVYAPIDDILEHPTPSDHTLRVLAMAMLAAEIEARGPLRLSRRQNRMLALIYEDLGARLLDVDLPAHACVAFRQARDLHAINADLDDQDRCGLALARARTRAQRRGMRRTPGFVANILCGYGYRPFRLLGWIACELALFAGALMLVTDVAATTAAHLSLIEFLNPLGLGDLDAMDLEPTARVLLIVESYLGSVTTSVFFALLVRRWFRL
ncbi:hypothetical protein ACWFRF_16045 [Nocardia sp. NPDC055165]|uniref:hypothetical protein n=1 Tax=Nocardia sp. NPDC060220 TaxID=3347076 RepID=UPI003650454F